MTEITSRLSTALADRYRIERHLGDGGMATVYLAEDLKHKRKVAVKVLRPELAAVLGAERFAVSLLRQSYESGATMGIWVHRAIDFESLRGYAPFEEFVRPR